MYINNYRSELIPTNLDHCQELTDMFYDLPIEFKTQLHHVLTYYVANFMRPNFECYFMKQLFSIDTGTELECLRNV